METPKSLPTPDAVLSCATQSDYNDGTPRVLGPKSAAAAAGMLTCCVGRPRKQPLPCLCPVFLAACLRQMSGRERCARRERRRLFTFKPFLSYGRPAKQRKSVGAQVSPASLSSAQRAAVGTPTAIRAGGGAVNACLTVDRASLACLSQCSRYAILKSAHPDPRASCVQKAALGLRACKKSRSAQQSPSMGMCVCISHLTKCK